MNILKICFGGSLLLGYLAISNSVNAQITSDGTLPTPTQVTPISDSLFEITLGTQAKNNQFHSFENFSVPQNATVKFINDNPSIKNVISRVTGQFSSEVLGKIEAAGKETKFNFFLINPNGISFGPNASIAINGSFVASTANAIRFGDLGIFDTSNFYDPSSLTIDPTAFWYNQIRPNSLIKYQSKFAVPSSNSILLLGGAVNVDNGNLTAPNGHIEIGGLAEPGMVMLNINKGVFGLTFPDSLVRSNTVFNNARIFVFDKGSGSINVNAQNIEVSGASRFVAGINIGNKTDTTNPGGIYLNATNSIILKENSTINNSALRSSIGNSGDISIIANSLSLNNNSAIITTAQGVGGPGIIDLKIKNGIDLSSSLIGSAVAANGQIVPINSANISIEAGSLSLSDGSNIRSNTFGNGNSGNIFIRVRDLVAIKDSIIFAFVQPGVTGNGGNIDLVSRSLSLTEGGQLSTALLGSTVNTPGARGRGGNITVNSSESITISGIGSEGSSGIFANTELGANGPAGNVNITTNSLEILENAEVKLSNPQGQAGTLEVKANSITLNQGKITAETGGSSVNSGANIKLTLSDFLRIENESLISAKANDSADGGNIRIDTPVLLALPPIGSNGSDIIANADKGTGGKITINSQGVFGIEERPADLGNQTNDFDASSDFGQSGQVQINTTTDVNQGLVELPATVLDPNTIISQDPCDRGWNSSFTLKSRGGNPQTPRQDLSPEAIQVGLVEPAPMTNTSAIENHNLTASVQGATKLQPPTVKQISPAQGWVYNSKGEVVLVAYNPTLTAEQRLQQHAVCTTKE